MKLIAGYSKTLKQHGKIMIAAIINQGTYRMKMHANL